MKSFYLTIVLIFASLFSFSSQNRKVLIIGIDGTRSDAFQQANTPHIDALLSDATFSYDSWHTGITWSGPSWSTILTGVNWNKHGVTDNSFANKNFNQYAPLPTLAKQIKPNLNCSIVAEWDPLIDEITNASWNHAVKVADGSNFPTADSAVIELQNPDIDLLFAYFDKVDLTGHTSMFSPTNSLYISAIQDVDSAVGKVLTALYARPTYSAEDWLILVVTDHGGTGYFHGGNTNEERHIWWIASGSQVAHQQITKADPGTYNCHLNNVFDTTCVDYNLLRQSPVHADITVTALHWLIYDSGINPETKPEWNLDGKSWLINTSGIKESSIAGDISIYPNPSSGVFTISGLQPAVQAHLPLEIFSADGRKVFGIVPTKTEMEVETCQFPRGIYFVKVGDTAQKLVVN
jgi:hypothetical protein